MSHHTGLGFLVAEFAAEAEWAAAFDELTPAQLHLLSIALVDAVLCTLRRQVELEALTTEEVAA